MKKKAVIVSGYFNPIHKGHLEYFNNAKALCDELFVIVNNDLQRALKGSKEFQKEDERMIIVSNIKAVDKAILSIDEDRTVCATLQMIAEKFGNEFDLAFANGGDQNNDTIPERPVCAELGINLIDELGDKIQSSSWILNKSAALLNIKAIITDVDGVLTNGQVIYSNNGDELKCFNVKDGVAFENFKAKRILTGIITGRKSESVQRRAEELGVDFLYQGVKNKLSVYTEIKNKYFLKNEEICYVGDDLNDIEVLGLAGLSVAPFDASYEAKTISNYISTSRGGEGVIRDVYNFIYSKKD